MTTLSPSVVTASMRRVDPAAAPPTPHFCQAAWDIATIATIASAAVVADDSLIVKDATPLLILCREKPDEVVVAIDIASIAANTANDGNPRLSALADMLLALAALKRRHTAAYCAVRSTVRMIVEPEYWDELLD